jgi:hypothetical protein
VCSTVTSIFVSEVRDTFVPSLPETTCVTLDAHSSWDIKSQVEVFVRVRPGVWRRGGRSEVFWNNFGYTANLRNVS